LDEKDEEIFELEQPMELIPIIPALKAIFE